MIVVNTEVIGERYFISFDGHAGYAESGHDLVCCAATTLEQAFRMYLEDLEDENRCSIQMKEEEEGHIALIVQGDHRLIHPAYRMIMCGIEALCNTYPENIKMAE